MPRPTLIDVALSAGVSRQTVSRVLNGSELVADHTRQRVLEAMSATGYRQNRIASSLRSGRTRTIGFVLSNVMNPFFAAELRGAQDVVEAHGYRVLVCNTDEDPDKEAYYLYALREQRVDGAIVVAIGDQSETSMRDLAHDGTRVVALNRLVRGVDSCTIDHPAGVALAVEHLAQDGHERIGLVLTSRFARHDARVQCFAASLQHRGLAAAPERVIWTAEDVAAVREAVLHLLDSNTSVDGLITAGYLVTLGALDALAQRGLRIPDDIGVIGNTRTEWAPFLTPPLTTVSGDPYALGASAAELLLQRLDTRDTSAEPAHRTYPNTLERRASCGIHTQRGSLSTESRYGTSSRRRQRSSSR